MRIKEYLYCRYMSTCNLVDLLLQRHGIAEDRVHNEYDRARSLTPFGSARTKAFYQALVQRGVNVDLTISSPYKRAWQTAQIGFQVGFAKRIEIEELLKPSGDLRLFGLDGLPERVCLVGHQPDLGNLACRLLEMPNGRIQIKKSGFVHLQRFGASWQLKALVRPGLLLPYSD